MDKKLIREKFHKENYKLAKKFKTFQAIKKIISSLKTKKKINLLIYIAKEKEVDILAYKKYLKNCNIYVTRMLQDDTLAFAKLRYPLEYKKFKIKESSSKSEKIKIDVAIIPVLGIDSDFRRIGYGKGYYDKTFLGIDYDLLRIFIQNTRTIINKKICSNYDIQGDYYIADGKIIKRKEKL